MPKRMSAQKHISVEVQGEDSYVVLMRPSVGQMRRAQESVKANGQSEAETAAVSIRVALDVLTENILDWNWVDENGEPLPLPKNDPAVMDTLTDMEVRYLTGLINPPESDLKNSTSG